MEHLVTGCGDGIWYLGVFQKGTGQISGGKAPSQVTSHDGGCRTSRFKRKVPPKARCRGGESGDRSLVVSHVLPEASGGVIVEIQGAGLEGPLA